MESVLSLNGGSDLKVPLIPREGDEEIGRPSEATAAAPVSSSHKLGFGALVFLIYYNIGVPFGDEEAVKAAGPFMVTLAFFVILPLVWQLPICFITAELTTTFQDHRGSIAWVSEAFGPHWGFVDAVWSFATSFLDNALYPLIIADFLGLTGVLRWTFVYTSISGLLHARHHCPTFLMAFAGGIRWTGRERLCQELSSGYPLRSWHADLDQRYHSSRRRGSNRRRAVPGVGAWIYQVQERQQTNRQVPG